MHIPNKGLVALGGSVNYKEKQDTETVSLYACQLG